mmetsp:Transcript_5899/g.14485  ORF Transcript_5899/g.14485 Transcript_5899/m.14485 type:complete len:212 (-) Transcript_5899:1232-1867(-)
MAFIQFRSAPAQKALPSAASTMARSSGFWPSAVNVAASSAISTSLKALRTSGRFSVTRATGPWVVTVRQVLIGEASMGWSAGIVRPRRDGWRGTRPGGPRRRGRLRGCRPGARRRRRGRWARRCGSAPAPCRRSRGRRRGRRPAPRRGLRPASAGPGGRRAQAGSSRRCHRAASERPARRARRPAAGRSRGRTAPPRPAAGRAGCGERPWC